MPNDLSVEFACKGPRVYHEDKAGRGIFQIYRILNRCTKNGVDNYEVQYWEPEDFPGADPDAIFVLPVAEIEQSYKKQAAFWETEQGTKWNLEFPTGRVWQRTPPKALLSLPNPKRSLADSPSKARRDPKKQKTDHSDSELDSDDERIITKPRSGKASMMPPPIPGPFKTAGLATKNQAHLVGTSSINANSSTRNSFQQGVNNTRTYGNQFGSRISPTAGLPIPVGSLTGRRATPSNGFVAPRPLHSKSSFGSTSSDPISSSQTTDDSNGSNDSDTADEDDDDDAEIIPVEPPRKSRLVVLIPAFRVIQRNDSPSRLPVQSLVRSPSPDKQLVDSDEEDDELDVSEDNESVISGNSGKIPSLIVIDDEGLETIVISDDEEDVDIFGGPSAAYAESQADLEDEDDEPDVQSSQSRLPGGISVYDSLSSAFITAHDHTVDSLLTAVLNAEGMPCDSWIAKRKASQTSKFDDLRSTLWAMLLSWDPLVLKHFTYGNLAKELHTNRDLRRKLNAMRHIDNPSTNNACPSTYAQYLVNDDGESPTPRILNQILDDVELYMRGLGGGDNASHYLAARVDTAFPCKKFDKETAVKGIRRYLEGDTQVRKCQEWVDNSRERLENEAPDVPLERPFVEIGYATYPDTRLAEHAKHTNSNYLMNLTDAICRVKYPEYGIAQFVVHQLVHEHHAMYDEILASRIALTYTSQGGGFCHFVAGRSNAGSSKMQDSYFEEMQAELISKNSFRNRVEKEVMRLRNHVELFPAIEKTARALLAATRDMLALDTEVEEAQEDMFLREGEMQSLGALGEDMAAAVLAFEAEDSEIVSDESDEEINEI